MNKHYSKQAELWDFITINKLTENLEFLIEISEPKNSHLAKYTGSLA